MKRITPTDILTKDFKTGLRGYDIEQVDEFLDQIVRHYEEILHENEQLKKELSRAKQKGSQPSGMPDLSEYDEIINEILVRLERVENRLMR